MKLESKIFIKGHIKAVTGLHIGGSKSSLDIGGVDLNVIKTAKNVPFIPGSSLKGKLRSLLARIEGSMAVSEQALEQNEKGKGIKTDEQVPHILELFGSSGDDDKREYVTRLLVRDAFLDAATFKSDFNDHEMELEYSDIKWENTIDRIRGTAKHPRQLERVPAGAKFKFEMVYDAYDDGKVKDHLTYIRIAMRLLEGDYIGGSGSRGYGKIKFEEVKFYQKDLEVYQGNNEAKEYDFQY